MTPLFVSPLRKMTVWTTLMSLVVLALAFSLSACGGDSAPAASTSSSSSAASVADALTVKITEQTSGNDVYSFDPTTATLKAGGAIKFTNNSDENHKLAITPAGPTAGTVTKSGSNDNTMTVTFPTAGTYTITSQLVDRLKDGKHAPDPMDSKATLTVTVS
jgi:plastocyanin